MKKIILLIFFVFTLIVVADLIVFKLIDINTRTGVNIKSISSNLIRQIEIQYLIMSGCVEYNDGCNGCSVVSKNITMCTMMYCGSMEEPKCFKYK